METSKYLVTSKIRLSDCDPSDTSLFQDREEAEKRLEECRILLAELQDKMYAQAGFSVLVILQAMDTAGKDGVVKHVFSGVNPQGVRVVSFKKPSTEELQHDYLWRVSEQLPKLGEIGVFNRSYYEDVLVTRVHSGMINPALLPSGRADETFWNQRLEQINQYERYLLQNRIIPIKIFLHISKEEQKKRLLARIDNKSKNWKFDQADVQERQYWSDYQRVYEKTISATANEQAPWYVIPANKKWYARAVVAQLLTKRIERLHPDYPQITKEQAEVLVRCKRLLEDEPQET